MARHRIPALLTTLTYLSCTLCPPDVFAHLAAPAPLAMTQAAPVATSQRLSQTLTAGWHLLPALVVDSPKPLSWLTQGLSADAVRKIDAATGLAAPATEIAAGQAYWVHLTQAGVFSPALPRDPTTTFVYDGDGGRVKQTTAAGTTLYLGELQEKTPDGTVTKALFAGSQRLASLVIPPSGSASLRFSHGDHLGSTNLITDGTGQVIEVSENTPYGTLYHHEGSSTSAHQFTGQRLDPATGLHFYNARYYDSQLGRFISPDPFVQAPSDPQTLNRYSYVRNNPVNYTDPSGHFAFIPFLIAAIIAVATVAAVVSVTTAVVSLLASATGHDRTAERFAKVSQVTAYISTPLLLTPESGLGMAAYFAAGAAQAAANHSDPVAEAFRGPSFETSPPSSPLQQTAGAVGEYATTTAVVTVALGAASTVAGAALRPLAPAAGPTLRKIAARFGPKLGKIGARGVAGQAARTGRPFAMGLADQGLDAFANARGATTWKQLPDPENWKLGVLGKLNDPNTPLHFNLDGVDVWQGVRRAASGGGGATDWELLQIQQNPQVWERLRFWRNGIPAENPFQ